MLELVCDVWLITCPKYVDGDDRPAEERIAAAFQIDTTQASWLVRRMPLCVSRGAPPAGAKAVGSLLRAVGAEVRVHSRRRVGSVVQLAPPRVAQSQHGEESSQDLVPIPMSVVDTQGGWEEYESVWGEMDSSDDRHRHVVGHPRPT